jgi:hypothetical protein
MATGHPEPERQPRRTAITTIRANCTTSTITTPVVLAARRAGRPSGVDPSRFSTPYWRSKPVAMPRPTIAVDITARARIPGARKSTASSVPVGSTSTTLKKRSSSTGMPMVSSSDSPRRAVSVSSTRVWAV